MIRHELEVDGANGKPARLGFSLTPVRDQATGAVTSYRRRPRGQASRVMITDKLKNAAAKREIMPGVEHRQYKSLNNRAENSNQPTRRRERIMERFKSPRQVQRFIPLTN